MEEPITVRQLVERLSEVDLDLPVEMDWQGLTSWGTTGPPI